MKDKQTLKWLYANSKGQLLQTLLLTVMRCSLTVLGVTFALVSRYVIDAAVAHDLSGLIKSSLSLLVIISAQIVIRLIGQSVETVIVAKLNMKMRSNLFKSILKCDYSEQTKYHSGDLLTRISDDTAIVSSGIISLIPGVLALLAGLLYALAALTRLDRNFAIILFVGGITLIAAISAFRGIMKKLHKTVLETEGKVRSFYQESLGSLLMVKVFGIEKFISKKGDELQNENYKAQMKRRNISIFAASSLSLLFSISSLYTLVYSSYRLYLGAITFGTLTAIIQLVNQIQSPFASLSGVMPQYYAILASAERIMEIENLPKEDSSQIMLNPKSDYDNLKEIKFTDISFGYGRDIVFSDANLSVQKGDFAVIGGISGIGKSTLIKLLLGVIRPESGSITLEIDSDTVPCGKHTRPLFSYVPQGNLLLSGTIRDAVSMVAPDSTDEEIMNAAEISCCADFINKLPQGLDTYIGEKGFGLSEGQIQRLAVCRAILSNAPIILLDEATSALDERTEAQLLKNIYNMKGKTCIIISHKQAAFEICNKHIYIEDKKIVVKDCK